MIFIGKHQEVYSNAKEKNNNNCIYFPPDNNNTILLRCKERVTGETGNDGTKDVEIMAPLEKKTKKCWRTLEMSLNDCEVSLMLNWSKNGFLVAGTAVNKEPTFTIFDTKLYVLAVT